MDSFILITHSYTVFKSSSIPSETNDVVDLNTRFACLKPVARVHSEPRSNSNFIINEGKNLLFLFIPIVLTS